MMKRFVSVFDYTIQITRKYRYLVVSSPEFGLQVSSAVLDLGNIDPEEVGRSVLRVFASIGQKLGELRMKGEAPPAPQRMQHWLSRELLSTRQAARALGLSPATLRRMVARNLIESERTSGGHLKFSLDSLSDYLRRNSAATGALAHMEKGVA